MLPEYRDKSVDGPPRRQQAAQRQALCRAQGVPLDEAIEKAGETRFVPILLTSATAIGGLLPLALQNIGLYSPMAWVIIGGLLSSTFLARLVTPVMYKLSFR